MFKNLFNHLRKKKSHNCSIQKTGLITNSYTIGVNSATSSNSIMSNAYSIGFGGATSSYYRMSNRSLKIKTVLKNIEKNKEKNEYGYII